MPIFSWSSRRQLAVFAVFAVLIFAVVGGLIYFFRQEPTCFDKRQNQGEEQTDCGGPCIPCAEQVRNLTILWVRFFPVREGAYDIAAMLENHNQFLKTDKFVYAVKLYDAENILIAIKENTTFIRPNEKFLVFEPNISTQNRTPRRAALEIRSVLWGTAEPEALNIKIFEKLLNLDSEFPRISFKLLSEHDSAYKNIEVSAAVLAKDGSILGVSRTFVERLGIAEEKEIVLTWPNPIAGASSAEIFLRKTP